MCISQVENPPDPPDNYGGRDSPYDNVQPTPRRSSPRKRPSTLPLFIGEHTNIDDLLGDTSNLCPSPVLSRIRKREPIEEGEFRTNLTRFTIDRVRVRGLIVDLPAASNTPMALE